MTVTKRPGFGNSPVPQTFPIRRMHQCRACGASRPAPKSGRASDEYKGPEPAHSDHARYRRLHGSHIRRFVHTPVRCSCSDSRCRISWWRDETKYVGTYRPAYACCMSDLIWDAAEPDHRGGFSLDQLFCNGSVVANSVERRWRKLHLYSRNSPKLHGMAVVRASM